MPESDRCIYGPNAVRPINVIYRIYRVGDRYYITARKQNNHSSCHKLLVLSRERARRDTKLFQTVSEISVLVPHTVYNIPTHFLLQ